MNPLISIIVPVYNAEAYLPKCLDSILAQSYNNLEILLIDDGSADSSGAICDDYAQRDARIRVYRKQNGGPSATRNYGLDRFQGEYLMFVDSDDFITENAVELLYQRIRQDESDMAVGQIMMQHADGSLENSYTIQKTDALLTGDDALHCLGVKNKELHCSPNAKLYCKSIFQEIRYPEHIRSGEDSWTLPRVLEKCRRISVSAEVIYYYYQHETSIVHTKSEATLMSDAFVYLHLVRFFLDRNIHLQAQTYFRYSIYSSLKTSAYLRMGKTIRNDFTPRERKILLAGCKRKLKLYWLYMTVPGLYPCVKGIMKCIKAPKKAA